MANVLGVTFEDVDASYEKTLSLDDRDWVETKIDEAVRELVSTIPELTRNISSGKIDAQLAKDKVVAAVLRVVRNPLGIDSEGEGDYTIRLRPTIASGDVWYLEKDLLQLGWLGKQNQQKPRTVHAKASRGWGFP